MGALDWRPIAEVPEGVEVLVRGGITLFGAKRIGTSVMIVDDRADLYKQDGTLRGTSPRIWHDCPEPPEDEEDE